MINLVQKVRSESMFLSIIQLVLKSIMKSISSSPLPTPVNVPYVVLVPEHASAGAAHESLGQRHQPKGEPELDVLLRERSEEQEILYSGWERSQGDREFNLIIKLHE